jgi:hypothetical protein
MAGAETGAGITVEVLKEEHVVPPVGGLLEGGDVVVDGAAAGGVG